MSIYLDIFYFTLFYTVYHSKHVFHYHRLFLISLDFVSDVSTGTCTFVVLVDELMMVYVVVREDGMLMVYIVVQGCTGDGRYIMVGVDVLVGVEICGQSSV